MKGRSTASRGRAAGPLGRPEEGIVRAAASALNATGSIKLEGFGDRGEQTRRRSSSARSRSRSASALAFNAGLEGLGVVNKVSTAARVGA
jgi:hypothetical protein